VTTGLTASIAVTFTGVTASAANAEVDLAIDPAGDLLTIDPAGDVLIVTPGVGFTGATASIVVPDFANALEGEGWVSLETEDGRILETEGS